MCSVNVNPRLDNLRRVADQAGPDDWDLARSAWRTYRTLTSRIALETGFTPRVGAAIFAALSPNNDYYGNLRDTRRVLAGVRAGLTPDQVKVSTYGQNKLKAWRIAQGEEPLDLIVYPKTRNFFLNVHDPDDPVPITIDGHIFNAWMGERIPLKGAAQRMNGRYYQEASEDVRRLGEEMALIPNQAQGLVWWTWRRIHGIKFDPQLEFWSREALHAGFLFHPASEPL